MKLTERSSYHIALTLFFIAIVLVGIIAADYVRENSRLKREHIEQADSLHLYRSAYLLNKISK